MPAFPSNVVVREVGLRDGLQSIQTVVPTARKIEWIGDAYAAGQREIEVGSFVPTRLLPQLADTAELVAFAKALPELFVSVLVPNLKGAERALESRADLLLVPLSASRAHSLANLRKTPNEVIAEVARIRAARDACGSKTLIEGGIGTAFGCTLQGAVAPAEVLRCMQALLDAGADRVSLADTVGYGGPAAVRSCSPRPASWRANSSGAAISTTPAASRSPMSTPRWRPAWPASMRPSPAWAAARHAPGASGNAASEDLAFMLADMGIATGIDLPRLLTLRAKLAQWLPDETLHGTLWRAGLPKSFAAADTRVFA